MARHPAAREIRRPRRALPGPLCRREAAVRHHRAEHGAVRREPDRRRKSPAQTLSEHFQDAGLSEPPRLPSGHEVGGAHQEERAAGRTLLGWPRHQQCLGRLAVPDAEERQRADLESHHAGPRRHRGSHLRAGGQLCRRQQGVREGQLQDLFDLVVIRP
ncbi:hypothetical protein D3C84_640160 [compost metagenome]